MKRTDVIQFFGNQARTAKALGITRQAVCRWPEIVPLAAAARVEKISQGRMKLNMEDYPPSRAPVPFCPLADEQRAA